MSKKKKSYVPVGKIKKHLRRLSIQDPLYAECVRNAKIAPAVSCCEHCGIPVYTGKSQKAYESKLVEYPNLLYREFAVDHIEPVVDVDMGWEGWDVYITSLYPGPDGRQFLCKPCHNKKSASEMAERKESGSLKRK